MELDEGRPVIIPSHGKSLKNKYFVGGGPHYHVFVLSGYDDETKEFIAEEPGTNFGARYRYSYTTIINAMHDYLPNAQTYKGRKVAIFTNPLRDPAFDNTDEDSDSLSKSRELEYGTSLLTPDTDRDSYSDGTEISSGFLPLLHEKNIPAGTLIQSSASPTIYQVKIPGKQIIPFNTLPIENQPLTIVSHTFIKKMDIVE
jgi:hypothetical protein